MNDPQQFRKKPVVVEAVQFCGGGAGPGGGPTPDSTSHTHAIYQWVEKNTLGSFEPMDVIEGRKPWPESGVTIDPRDGRMVIATLEGGHWVNLFDWVIRGTEGEFYPCKPAAFAATYTPVGDERCDDEREEIALAVYAGSLHMDDTLAREVWFDAPVDHPVKQHWRLVVDRVLTAAEPPAVLAQDAGAAAVGGRSGG